jgi:hypothetical protein
MLSLIADPSPVTLEVVPETLLFDTTRLLQLQSEYNRIIDGATMLIMANNSVVGGDKNPSQEKCSVLKDLASLVVGGADFDTVITEFSIKLDSVGVLTNPAARGKLVNSLSSCLANKNDSVRQLM